MTFSKESSSDQSDLIDLDKRDSIIKLTEMKIDSDDSEDELRVEDVSSSSSFVTSSEESSFANALGL